jgi:gp39
LEEENVGLKSTIEANNQSKADADKQLEEMQNQISNYETASLRTRVALQYGLPYDLADRLQGTDEDSFKADAERLAGFMKPVSKVAPVKSTEPIVPKEDDKRTMYRNLVKNLSIED